MILKKRAIVSDFFQKTLSLNSLKMNTTVSAFLYFIKSWHDVKVSK